MKAMSQTQKMLLIGIVFYAASYVFTAGTVVSDVLRVIGGLTLFVTAITFFREWGKRKKGPTSQR